MKRDMQVSLIAFLVFGNPSKRSFGYNDPMTPEI